MALSDLAVRNAKADKKQRKLTDGGGLYLLVKPSGSKLWRLKYYHLGAEKLLAVGAYPDVGLKEARLKREEARKLLSEGKDPGIAKKQNKAAAALAAATTFQVVADEYIAKREQEGWAEATLVKTRWFAAQVTPSLGKKPIAEIEPFEILSVLKKIEKKGNHESAKRVCQFTSRVFRYAIITGRTRYNPASELSAALVTPTVKHHSAIIEPSEVGKLLRAIDGYTGFATTKLALKLCPHVFVRPGELRHAEWSEIDLVDAKVWRIPASKMKLKLEHVVPLSRQAIEILTEAKSLTGSGRFVFPSIRSLSRPMSENTVTAALRGLGYSSDQMTAHGFRSTASTLLNETGKWSPDAIERALAHKDRDPVRAAYHRGAHWKERVAMAQWWSDHLDGLKSVSTL